MHTLKLRITIMTFVSLISFTLNAQYISSVTYPDSTIQVVTDTSDISVKLAQTITATELEKHLSILAGDGMEGRETGTEGNNKAAKYIHDYYDNLDMPNIKDQGDKYQDVFFSWSKFDENYIRVGDESYKHLWDYLAFPTKNPEIDSIKPKDIIFLGYGIHDRYYSDYKGNKIKGKTILIYDGEPINDQGISQITGTEELSIWSTEPDKKLALAKRMGAEMVLIISPDIKEKLGANRRLLLGPVMKLGKPDEAIPYPNHIYISSTLAQAMWGKAQNKIIKARNGSQQKAKPKSVKFKTNTTIALNKTVSTLEGYNVMGYIEGTDKKEELVVISAHFDHLGKRGDDIFNGADDNGSGTSGVLELAEAFQIAKKQGYGPRRSVLCLHVTGEEKGLLGSAYYAENPVFPLENTVVDVNVDMIGRIDNKYANQPNYIYVIGSDRLSSELHEINEMTNRKYTNMTLDYTYNSESDPNRYYFRSDHYNFAERGVPAIFYFSGVHKDYHRPSDTVEKINFDKMQTVTRQIFHTAWELANRDKRIKVDVKGKK